MTSWRWAASCRPATISTRSRRPSRSSSGTPPSITSSPTAPRSQKYGITNELVAKTIGAGKNPDGCSNGQFLGTEAAKIIILKPLSEILTPEEGRKRLRYLGALMQQAGITTTGDLFYGGVNLQLENMLTRGLFRAAELASPASCTSPTASPSPDSIGDGAIDEVDQAARQQQRAH